MRIEKFKVCFCKKDMPYFITFFIITLIACIFILFNADYRGIAIFGILFTVCTMLLFVSTILFKVEVENNCFKVRTKLGKKNEFNLSDIERVFCIKKSGVKLKNKSYIKIYAKEHFYEVNNQMEGFETLAEYFIQMYINDELYENAIDKATIEQLKFYASKKYRKFNSYKIT